MANEIQIFNNPQFGNVRIQMNASGEPLFCLTDVCKALELDSSQVVKRLEDGVVSIHPILDKLGRGQRANFINEEGLYDVILDSRKPSAKLFRKWVTGEALPSIRKTGSYSVNKQSSQPQLPTDYLSALKALVVSEEERQSLMLENKEQQKIIVKLEEDSRYLNQILNSREAIIVSVIAQDYGMTAAEFNRLLNGLNIQYKKSGTWILCSKYLKDGYVISSPFDFKHKDGRTDTKATTKWTRKGQKFLYYKLREHGILPLIERNAQGE